MNQVRIARYNKVYKLYVDDVYLGGIYKSDFERAGLIAPESEYIDISDEQLTDIRDRIYMRAYNKAVGYLASTECTATVIRDKLKLKGFSDSIIEDVIKVLYLSNYLNDGRYVESYVRSYMHSKSRKLIERELEDRSIDVSKYQDIIDEVYSDEGITEESVIEELMRKKYSNQNLEDMKVKRRAMSYLSRHGFSYDVINNYLT